MIRNAFAAGAWFLALLTLLMFGPNPARAVVEIDITRGNPKPVPMNGVTAEPSASSNKPPISTARGP